MSSQYHAQDHHGGYSYGYADPNSQKHEERSANGVTTGAYSYVDAHGIHQTVKYHADPHTGFHVAATNLPKAPLPVHAAPLYYHAAPAPVVYAAHIPYAHHAAPEAHIVNGAPAKTYEVQAAEAAHFAAHAEAKARLHHGIHKRSAYGASYGYAALPVIHNGVPVDTPEVQHAKAEHFAAHSRALAGQYHASVHAAPLAYTSYAHGAYNGAPVETPEVQHAKAAHFAAHAAARSGHSYAAPVHHYAAVQHYQHNGAPVDTPEVQHAKAEHFAAVAKAQGYAPAHSGHHYTGPLHYPVIHNGVPVETPEVQHAKAAHLAAVAKEQSNGHYDHGHYDDGHQYDDGQYDNKHYY